MDTLVIVKHLHALAEKEDNREPIVKDQGCLPGLVLFLDNDSNEVVHLVLKTLNLLAEHVPNRKIMFSEVGMVTSLRKVMQDDDERYKEEVEIKKLASLVYNKIQPPIARVSRQRVHTVAPTSQKFFVGSSNRKAKLVTLQLKGLEEGTRQLCEQTLLAIKGVVSFTFNMGKQRCMVRIVPPTTPEILHAAIEKTKVLSAEQVVRNKSGEEVIISFGRNPQMPDEAESRLSNEFPDYLPEDEPVESSDAAVVKPGDKDGGSGWLSGVSSFISNTLYW